MMNEYTISFADLLWLEADQVAKGWPSLHFPAMGAAQARAIIDAGKGALYERLGNAPAPQVVAAGVALLGG